jgi:hypothetical protein
LRPTSGKKVQEIPSQLIIIIKCLGVVLHVLSSQLGGKQTSGGSHKLAGAYIYVRLYRKTGKSQKG